MKRKTWIISLVLLVGIAACQKANQAYTSLSASTTQAVVGQTVNVELSTNQNASSWTVTPSSSVSQTYTITTTKVNNFTFATPGVYTVGVRTRNIAYSPNQSLDSCWHHGGGDGGGCHHGVDSASV